MIQDINFSVKKYGEEEESKEPDVPEAPEFPVEVPYSERITEENFKTKMAFYGNHFLIYFLS